MIKVLHIIPVFATGGAERLVLQYAKLLSKENFEVAVASCVEDGELRAEFAKLGVKLFVGSRIKMGGRHKVYNELAEFVKEWQPQIVHTHMLSADFFGWNLKRKYKNIKWVSTMHNVETATSYPRQLLWRFILRRADKVISVCQKVENFTLKEFKIKQNKSVVILNGVELTDWLKIPTNDLFNSSELKIACVGRFWEQKGHKYLLQALSSIKDFSWKLYLFGDGPLKSDLLNLTKELGLEKRVEFLEVVSDVPKKLGEMDLVVQPSLWEGLSLVVMEAMAEGRLVLASAPAAEELVKDNFTGLVVPAKDTIKLAESLKWIIEHKNDSKLIAEAGREFAKNNFDIQINIKKLAEVYEGLV